MVGGGGGGAGSSSNATGGTGGTGGTSTFGSSLLTCTGGAGGTGANPSVVGAGGTATLNSPAIGVSFNGQSGGGGEAQGPFAINQSSGPGGNTPFLGGGQSVSSSNTAITGQTAIANTGSGGAGGVYVSASGAFCGAGGGAGGYIKATISSPSSTYSYAVGAAGTAGTAGTSGAAGGAGAAGIIIVTEYYDLIGIPTNLTLPIPVNQGGTGITTAPIFSATGTATGTLNTSFNGVVYPTVSFDTTSSYNASTGIYTAPVKGRYVIYGSFSVTGVSITAGNYVGIAIAQNGNRRALNVGRAAVSTGNGTFTSQVTSIYQLNAGDTVQILSVTNYGTPSYSALLEDAEFRFNVTCIGSY
jgi:hypothetical protein